MKNLLLSLLVIYTVLLSAACPQNATREAAKASYSLSGLTVDVAKGTARAYQDGIIGIETKDRIANYLKTISIGGKRFNNTLEIFVKESGENLPTDKLAILNTIFNDEVIAPFLEILTALKVLPSEKAQYLRTAIAALRSSILIISAGFTAKGLEINTGGLNAYV